MPQQPPLPLVPSTACAAAKPVDKNGLVEVYDATQRAYFPGCLKDLDQTRVLVQFDSADGKQNGPVKWFDRTVVREMPPPLTGQTMLEEGQLVEVSYADEGSNEKPAWWEAKILQKKGPYFKVHFLCGSFPDEFVEIHHEKIRPATPSANRGMGPLYTKQTLPVSDAKLHASFVANEETLMLSVREKAQLLAIYVDKKSPQLRLIGTAKSIAMGKMLIELHEKMHHEKMLRMHSDREVFASKREIGLQQLNQHLQARDRAAAAAGPAGQSGPASTASCTGRIPESLGARKLGRRVVRGERRS